MKKNSEKIVSLAVALLLPQLVGGVGAVITNRSIPTWYRRLRKPSWSPPAKIFPVVWTALYLMMGAASWLVWQRRKGIVDSEDQVREALGAYGLQLAFNFGWSIIFFGLRRIDLALAEIAVLWGLILNTMVRFYRLSPTAGLLLVPYQVWTTFASALNASLWRLNRDE